MYQSARNRQQQPIARRMAQRIVDELEPVEIQIQHGGQGIVPLRRQQFVREDIVQHRPVRQIRTRSTVLNH